MNEVFFWYSVQQFYIRNTLAENNGLKGSLSLMASHHSTYAQKNRNKITPTTLLMLLPLHTNQTSKNLFFSGKLMKHNQYIQPVYILKYDANKQRGMKKSLPVCHSIA